MARKWFFVLSLLASFIAPRALAEDLFVLVFLEDAPLRHVKVAVDGKIVGVTDGKGLVQASLTPGAHKLYLIDDDLAIPVRFNIPKNGEIEVSAVFSREQGVEPVVKSQAFTADSDATGYIAGVVTSPSGLAIAGATVEVVDVQVSTKTDAEGIYTLELPRGLHSLEITRDGYRSSSIDAIRVFAGLGVNARL